MRTGVIGEGSWSAWIKGRTPFFSDLKNPPRRAGLPKTPPLQGVITTCAKGSPLWSNISAQRVFAKVLAHADEPRGLFQSGNAQAQGASRSTLQILDLYHFTGTVRRRTAVFICRQAMAQLFVKFGRAEDRKGRRKRSGALS